MSLITVPHYGVVWDEDGIPWILQGRGSTNGAGLAKKSPYEVRLPSGKRHCNHQIPTATPVPNDYHWNYFLQLLGDPLVRAMLPLPKKDGGVYYVADDSDSLTLLLVMLSTMSSPIYNVVLPMWMMTPPIIVS